MNLQTFKVACLNNQSDIIVQQYLIEGSSYYFNEYYDSTEEFNFKKALSESLNIHIREIAIIGSAKLGFSIKPTFAEPALYEYKEFDFNYKRNKEQKKSDIDIAVISSSLFDNQLLELYKYTNSYKNLNGFKKKQYYS